MVHSGRIAGLRCVAFPATSIYAGGTGSWPSYSVGAEHRALLACRKPHYRAQDGAGERPARDPTPVYSRAQHRLQRGVVAGVAGIRVHHGVCQSGLLDRDPEALEGIRAFWRRHRFRHGVRHQRRLRSERYPHREGDRVHPYTERTGIDTRRPARSAYR